MSAAGKISAAESGAPCISSDVPDSSAADNSEPPAADVLVQYVVLRRDLIDSWPLGSVVTQGCHASVAAIWLNKDNDLHTQTYCSPSNLENMHKGSSSVPSNRQLSMSTTQAKTQVIGKEKRGSLSPFVRPQLGNLTKPTNASKPVISTANSRTPKPTTTTSLKPSSTANPRTPKPTTTTTALKPSSTANSRTPKPTTITTALKSSSTVSLKPSKTASTIKSTTTTRNVEKPPTLNRRGSLNNAPSSVRIQRSLSTAKTTVGEKLVQSKSAPSLETIDKSVPKSPTRKPEDDNAMQTEPERISSDNQDVSVLSNETVNVIEDDHSNQNHIDNDCLDKTIEHEIEHKRDETENELKEGENKTETTIDQSSEHQQQEVVESFLKASEIRRRMEAQAGSNEAVTPRWQVVRGGGNRVFNRKEMVSPVSNEVIEETTSKLIRENKKNKVLAMVGAFETVISNQ